MTTVKLVSMTNFSDAQRARAEEARRVIETTVNSNKFQDAVRKATFLDVRLEKPDGSILRNLTNEQILNIILKGTEAGSAPDSVIDIKVALYNKLWSSAIGFTSNGVIHTRDKFFNGAEVVEIAGHWLHEWTHAAGFLHDFSRTSRREQSVPYLVGELLIETA